LTHPFTWSVTILPHFGVIGALAVTAAMFLLRRKRLADKRTMAILLAPVWAIYMLEYSLTTMAFTLRGADWKRNLIYLIGCYILGALFWQEVFSREQYGALGMMLLAALLAPDYTKLKLPKGIRSQPTQSTQAV
jgi:peptidoglycan/LPS O-acetylase OafA/YrhL